MKIDIISIDLGRSGAFALWSNSVCRSVIGWSFLSNRPLWQEFKGVIDIFETLIMNDRAIVVIEKPSRNMAIQWVLYNDIRFVSGKNRLEFVSYMPTEIKKTVTGYGRSDKDEVLRCVRESEAVNLEIFSDHESDAIAVGLCYLMRNENVKCIE